ncbi:MAG: hypothetical protein RR878_12625 [Anaerorhabdus sp.]|uniref:hypothetical protein n=1 Tax=Anaerorhabdus sp. TaxID=1872524 RepID=UPI002FC64FAE
MTPEQFAQFEIFNQLNFWGGLFLGLIIAGFFKTLKSCLNSHVQRPRRIRFGNLNGRAERKDDFEYLYLFKNEYYTLEQRDFLLKERLKKFKQIKSPFSFFFPVFCASLFLFLIAYFFFNAPILGL